MPFITGSANSIPDLRAALLNGLVANGFTLDGNVIYKGDVFFDVSIPTGEAYGENRMIRVLAGTGQAGGVLSGDAPFGPRLGFARDAPWTFPVTYNLHILTNPDEVYFKVRRDVNDYQFAALGQSNVPGLLGTGAWVTTSLGDTPYVKDYGGIKATGADVTNVNDGSYAPFWCESVGDGTLSNVLHHGFDGGDWAIPSDGLSTDIELQANRSCYPLISRSPNAWNAEANLLPIQPCVKRPSNKASIGADLAHARYLRIDNYNPEEIIDLTPDQWMVYPFRAKNTEERDGGKEIYHTGTFGWAIRYDGP